MRAAEILRQMANMIDAKSQPEQHDHEHEHSDLIPVPNDVFLPPGVAVMVSAVSII